MSNNSQEKQQYTKSFLFNGKVLNTYEYPNIKLYISQFPFCLLCKFLVEF